MKKLVHVPFEEAVVGERYLTNMKHGWIEGFYDGNETCHGYYWRDMEWYASALYKIVEENSSGDVLNS